MTFVKPFDILNEAKGKEVVIELKNNEVYSGSLEAFDVHLNVALKNAKMISSDSEKEVGTVLIRGDALITIKNL